MIAVAVYRLLLRCYPAPFRHEYGSEMLAAFTAEVREADQQGGRWSAASVQLRTIVDLLFTAPKEHFHVIRLDIRYAIRTLISQPGFTMVAVLSLALGIGANIAIFSLLNSILLSSLPVRDPKTLIMLTDPASSGLGNGSQGGERALLTYTEFEQLRDHAGVFLSLMASQSELDRIQARTGSGEPEEVRSRMVSNEYFGTLGIHALIGRTLQPSDELRVPYAVISYDFWQRRFGGKMEAVGRSVTIHNGVFTIIGVMPPSFFGETVGDRPDVWLPLGMQPVILPGRDYLHERQDASKDMWLHVFGRLRAGITVAQAQAAANLVFKQDLQSFYTARLSPEKAKELLNQRLVLRPAATGASDLRTRAAGPLKLLLAASGLVLLIACANLGNLMLIRQIARTRELAVRTALGANRQHIIRQVATESLMIAVLGGSASLFLAWFLNVGLARLFSDAVRLPTSPGLIVLLFAFCLTLLAGLAVGLMPILSTLGSDVVTGLKEQGRGLTGSATWMRVGRIIVAGQLALSLPLLVGAGLLLRTFYNLQNASVGFEKDHVLTFEVDALAAGVSGTKQFRFFSDVLNQVRSVPGVRAATFSNNGFFTGNDSRDSIDVEGYVPKGKEDRRSRYEHVGPGFFSALGIPIRLGREIGDRDNVSGSKVCVTNEAFARTFFRGRNPLGLHVTQKFANERNTFQVVGVVQDSRQNKLRDEIETRFYLPAAHPVFPLDSAVFEVRTAGDPLRLMTAVRKSILSWNSNVTITNASTLTAAIDQRITQDRILGRLSTAFGVVGLILAAIGLYGVLSYSVARRTGEMGIRKALGAPERAVILMVLRETGWLLTTGFGVGSALTVVAIRVLNSRLYGLSRTDPLALISAAALLAVVALLAALMPALRASRVDPLVALRYE